MYVFVENLKINDKLFYQVFLIFVDCEILLKTKRIDSPMYGLPGIVDT